MLTIEKSLTDYSLSELIDKACALGGDFYLAREIGHVRHKKTWITMIERLTSLDVEVEEVEPVEEVEVHHESRRDMMLAEVERTRQIFEGDSSDDIPANNDNNIVIWDDNRDKFFPMSIEAFEGASITLRVGDMIQYEEDECCLTGEIKEIYFKDIQAIKELSPELKIVDSLLLESFPDAGNFVFTRIKLSQVRGHSHNAVDIPPPPPEKPPIVHPVPVTDPIAPWEKCNTPGSDRRECDKPVITERGTGRQPATTGGICHVCEGTGNILDGIECLKCDGKGYLSISDKVLFTAQDAVKAYVKKVSEQVKGSMATLPIEEVKIMAKDLLAADLLSSSERSLSGISKAIDIAMKYAPAVLPPFPWMKLKNRQAFLAVEKLDGYDFPFSNYYVGQLPYWPEVYLYLFPSCNDAEKYLNSILICGDFAILEVG